VLLEYDLLTTQLKRSQFGFFLFEGVIVDIRLMMELLIFVEQTVDEVQVELLPLL